MTKHKQRGGFGLHRPAGSKFWWFDFRINAARHRATTGLTDRRAAEEAARAVRTREERRAAGLVSDADEQATRPIGEHVAAYEGVVGDGSERKIAMLRRFVAHAEAKTIA